MYLLSIGDVCFWGFLILFILHSFKSCCNPYRVCLLLLHSNRLCQVKFYSNNPYRKSGSKGFANLQNMKSSILRPLVQVKKNWYFLFLLSMMDFCLSCWTFTQNGTTLTIKLTDTIALKFYQSHYFCYLKAHKTKHLGVSRTLTMTGISNMVSVVILDHR